MCAHSDLQLEFVWCEHASQLPQCVLQMAEALAVVHGCKMVHMDIKPDNIYASSPEGSFKLGDFGMATMKSAAIQEEGDNRSLLHPRMHFQALTYTLKATIAVFSDPQMCI